MILVYVNDIVCSLQNKCYFTALFLALALPDICGFAEYPNKTISERYIEWYDKYIYYKEWNRREIEDETPHISGEMVYNLRNTYFHQGSPNIMSSKIRNPVNQIDRLILILGDGESNPEIALNINVGSGNMTFKAITVDVTCLCNRLCKGAFWYYEENAEKFKFDCNVIPEEIYNNPSKEAREFAEGDVVAAILNRKYEQLGRPERIVESQDREHTIFQMMKKEFEKEVKKANDEISNKCSCDEKQKSITRMKEDTNTNEISNFLSNGILTSYPAKYKKRMIAIYYLATKLESDRKYSEKEINEVIDKWTAFHDPATIRREMYNRRLISRTQDGTTYWKEEMPELEEYLEKWL